MSKINENDVMKISDESGKTSLPGNKDLYRVYGNNDFYDVIALEDEKLEDTGNIKKLTIDYISDGKKIAENYELLELKKAKKYYDSNLMLVRKVYGEKLKIKRVHLSEKLKELKNLLLKINKNKY